MKQIKQVGRTFALYWTGYGGLRALAGSPYLWAAALFTLACFPLCEGGSWCDTSLQIIPSVLGFSLGGYAILLAFGDEDFRSAIAGEDDDGKQSPFMVANSSFVHFIVVNTTTLLFTIFCKAWGMENSIAGFVGVTLLTYSIFCGLASVFAIYHVSRCFDMAATAKRKAAAGK